VGHPVYRPGVEQPNAGIHALWRGIALRWDPKGNAPRTTTIPRRACRTDWKSGSRRWL